MVAKGLYLWVNKFMIKWKQKSSGGQWCINPSIIVLSAVQQLFVLLEWSCSNLSVGIMIIFVK